MNLEPVNRVIKISVLQEQRNQATYAALNNRMSGVAKSAGKVSNNARGAALATRNLGYVAQNASYQVADFFVMLQGGVGVGRALSTQLPQLLAGFGQLGAVLGAVAAIGASVVVMLQNQNKVTVDVTEVTDAYEEALSEANGALIEFVTTGKAGTRTMKEFTAATLELAKIDLSEVLAPPDATAWDGYLRGIQRFFQIAKEGTKRSPVLGFIVQGLDEVLQALNDYYADYGDITQSYDNSIYNLIKTLSLAQSGTEKFARAFGLLNAEINDQFYVLAQPLSTTGFPLFDEAKQAFDLVVTGLTLLEGTAEQSKWSELSKRQAQAFKTTMEEAENAIKSFRQEYFSLTELQSNGVLEALLKESDLDKAIRNWRNAAAAGLVTAKKAEEAIAGLVEIDRWEPLQDIIIDIGKSFEDQIIGAMKSGKFAVADFVSYALEQFAKLALSRVFEPFFLLIANALPSFGGGSPSPGGVGTGQIRMGFDAPESVAPMYNYGESIGRVPGASRSMIGMQSNKVTVNVNNYGNDEVGVSESTDSNGGLNIDVIIKRKVNQGFAAGDFDRAIGASFGLRRLGY